MCVALTHTVLFRLLDASRYNFLTVRRSLPLFSVSIYPFRTCSFSPAFPNIGSMRRASRRTCCDYSSVVLVTWYKTRLGRQRRATVAHHGRPSARPPRSTDDSLRNGPFLGRAETLAHLDELGAKYESFEHVLIIPLLSILFLNTLLSFYFYSQYFYSSFLSPGKGFVYSVSVLNRCSQCSVCHRYPVCWWASHSDLRLSSPKWGNTLLYQVGNLNLWIICTEIT